MKLLASGYVVTETTFVGTTAGGGGMGSTGTYGAGRGFTIQKVVSFSGGSTIGANSSGGIVLVCGDSSDYVQSTYVVLPYPRVGDASSVTASAPLSVELDGLNIKCNWFEARTNESAAGGWGIFVFGE